ncbi:hypothetical protein Tcan_04305, partial [Toxocara canis]
RTKAMEEAWIAVAKECFPRYRDEFVAYHFKHIQTGRRQPHKQVRTREQEQSGNDEQASSSNTSWKWCVIIE